MGEEHLKPELAALEAALAELVPKPTGIARDRLMFRAGQAAAVPLRRRWTSWAWTLSLAANVLLAVTLGGWALREKACEVQGIPTAIPEVDAPAALAATSYGRLRKLMLEQGVEAFSNGPAEASQGATPPSPGNDLRKWLKELGQS